MINIWYSNISGIDQKKYELYLHQLPVECRKEIERYKFFKDRALRLTGKLLLRKAIVETNHPVELIGSLEKNKNNKPFINEWMPFNISHSGDYIVLAFGGNSEIGIDIEFVDENVCVNELSDFFTEQEKKKIQQTNNAASFFDIWVRKEAVLKAISIGVLDGMDRFDCLSDLVSYKGEEWFLRKNKINEKYVSYLATNFFCGNIVEKEQCFY